MALRALSAHANQVETFPLIVLAAWLSAEAGVASEDRAASMVLIMLMRFAHTFAYYADNGLVRSIAWLSVVYVLLGFDVSDNVNTNRCFQPSSESLNLISASVW